MEIFWKSAAAVLLASVLGLVLDRQGKDFSALLNIAVCTMAGGIALSYLKPVLSFLRELEEMGGMQGGFMGILLQVLGVGITSELIGLICTDAGKASLGKALQLLGSAVGLHLSLPLFRALVSLIRQILGGI